MKLLVVFFALTILSGCQAFVLRDESNTKVDQLKRDLFEYSDQLLRALFRKTTLVEESDIGKPLSSWHHDTDRNIEPRLAALEGALPAEAKEFLRQLSSAVGRLERRVANGLRGIHNELLPERRALRQALEADLNPVLEKLDPYLQPWRQRLVQTCVELNAKLDELLKWQLEVLQPRAEKFRSWVQDVQGFFDSTADQVQEQIKLGLEEAREVLQRFAARGLQVLEKHREGFDQWVGAP